MSRLETARRAVASVFHLILAGLLAASTPAAAQTVVTRTSVNLDEDWRFHLGHAADPHRDFNYGIFTESFAKAGAANGTPMAIDFRDQDWKPVQLPHDCVVALPPQFLNDDNLDAHGYKPVGGKFPENSIGWYRRQFSVDAKDSGGRFELQFDGVYRDSKVWVNGYHVGGNFSGYTGATYDITDFIRFGKKNVITVRVDATQYEGWFYEGAGIYRHVWLNRYNNLHLVSEGGLYVRAEPSKGRAMVAIEAEVKNHNLKPVEATVQAFVLDRNNRVVAASASQKLNLAVYAQKKAQFELQLKNPTLWDLDHPYLYRAVAVVRTGNYTVDSFGVRFGVRSFVFDKDSGFYLNGKPLKIKGTSNHQDHAGVGAALPDYLQYYRIGLLKEMGCNAYRATHNPPTPELLDACDSLGMLVMDETRLLTSGNEYANQWKTLLLRDRNHASIMLWSIGNEEYATQRTNIGKRIALNQLALQQQLDPGRTATYAANMGNVYEGVNEVIPVRGFNYNLPGADGYHKNHPLQPVIGTEVASTVTTRSVYVKDSVRAYVPDYDSTYPPWATTAETWWRFCAERPWFMGGFAWTGFDYRGEPTPYRWPNVNSHFGIMDMCGFPKNVYYYYQSWWTDKDVLHIAPHWNWRGDEGKPKLVWVNSNADNVELFLNGKSLGRKDMPRNGHLRWTVNYEPGTLEAVAYKNGRKITSRIETTGAPQRVVLTPSKASLLADGSDAVVVNVSVVDKEGREVPDAENLIQFAVKGARLLGVGNGDPSSHEADQQGDGIWQRKLFGGKAQIILGSVRNTTSLELAVQSTGLQAALLQLPCR